MGRFSHRKRQLNSNLPLFPFFLLLLAAVSIGAKDRRLKIGFGIATILCAVVGAPERFGFA